MIEWEMYHDESYYGMWAVRPIDDHDMNSPRLFHFLNYDEAIQFLNSVRKAHCAKLN